MKEEEIKVITDLTRELKRQNDLKQEKKEVVVKKSPVKKVFVGIFILLFAILWKEIKNNNK